MCRVTRVTKILGCMGTGFSTYDITHTHTHTHRTAYVAMCKCVSTVETLYCKVHAWMNAYGDVLTYMWWFENMVEYVLAFCILCRCWVGGPVAEEGHLEVLGFALFLCFEFQCSVLRGVYRAERLDS